MGKATLVKANLPGFRGEASLYKMEPPIQPYFEFEEEPDQQYEFVVVSAANTYSGIETYLFGSNEAGEIVDWAELPGSTKGTLSHAEALENAGYEVSA